MPHGEGYEFQTVGVKVQGGIEIAIMIETANTSPASGQRERTVYGAAPNDRCCRRESDTLRPAESTGGTTRKGAFGALSAKYAQARAQNDLDTVAVTCGEVVGLLKDRPPAAAVVESMVAQAVDLLRNGGKLRFSLAPENR